MTDYLIPCKCGAVLTAATYDPHMSAKHRDPEIYRRNADRAVIARIGGRLYVSGRHAEWGDSTIRYAAETMAALPRMYGTHRVPEAAFDWPIYRIAVAANVCRDLGYEEEDIYELVGIEKGMLDG